MKADCDDFQGTFCPSEPLIAGVRFLLFLFLCSRTYNNTSKMSINSYYLC